jgi:hypothetical protein
VHAGGELREVSRVLDSVHVPRDGAGGGEPGVDVCESVLRSAPIATDPIKVAEHTPGTALDRTIRGQRIGPDTS